MNKLAWSGIALAIAGVAAAGIGGTACTVTSGAGDDGGITYLGSDSGSDAATGSDSGGGGDDAGADTGTTQDGGGDAAPVCETDAGNACDMCLGQSCCAENVACQQDTNTISTDAGQVPGCVDYVGCVGADLAAADGGISLSQAETDCSGGDAGGTYAQSSVQAGNALLNCASTSCAAQCQ